MADENTSYVVSKRGPPQIMPNFAVSRRLTTLIFRYAKLRSQSQGNKKLESEAPRPSTLSSGVDLKSALPGSPSSGEVSVDDQSDDNSSSSGDEIDDMTAESGLKPYIFSSDGENKCSNRERKSYSCK